jgi:hypothetical protein
VAGPILGIDFLRKFKVIVSPEFSQIQFACSAAAPSAHILPSAAPSAHITPTAAPPASYRSSSFSSRENKSLLDPPTLFQKIPDSMPDDVKILLKKFPSILTLDRSQTTCHCHFSCFSPHFTQTTAPFGIHFRIQCANFVFAWFKKCRCRFFVPQTTQPLDQSPPRRRQIQWISKSKTVAQKRSICWAAHPLN